MFVWQLVKADRFLVILPKLEQILSDSRVSDACNHFSARTMKRGNDGQMRDAGEE